ncbi:MAG: COR domain-containing protein [Snowella sp.]
MVKDTNWAANEWVEAWVEQARDAGLVELDLSDRNLTLLPENLFEYENLQGLSLDTNRLKLLDKKIGNLVNLEYLDLSNNEIEYLPNEIEKLTSLVVLNIDLNYLKDLPRAIKNLKNLQSLGLSDNKLIIFPKDIYSLNRLKHLDLSYNKINQVPDSIAKLHRLEFFDMSGNKLKTLPNIFENLTKLKELNLSDNDLATLPESLVSLDLQALNLDNNPFEPELLAAYEEGIKTTLAYLRAKAESKVILNEGKLILVGEGEVGKSCLLGALRGDEWVENRLTTHGIEIKPCQLIYSDTEITLNGWDFGGQPVYRPTHQLFFSSPAVYLVVWKPRERPQQGFVEYWITLIKRRAPEAKIIVVATHGGPNQRQPDIDRQILIDKFGQDTLIGFFFVNSKPDENSGITELKHKIAEVAYQLPEMGRTVPTKWQKVREELKNLEQAYLPYQDVIDICETAGMEQEQAKLFLKISHILGHLIYYEIDPTLGDIVILKPDWLAKAISFVLDDHETRISKGLIEFERLSNLWQHPPHKDEKGNPESGYPESLHPIFLRLMERFDLSYRIKVNGELT